jgi:hypothetical protein
MKSAILMTSVAVAALASPAFAGPDRFDQGASCIGMSGAECVQAQMRLEDGNRAAEKPAGAAVGSGDATASTGAIGGTGATAFGARSAAADDEDLGDEVGDEAEEIGDEVSDTAEEVGDEVGDTADEAGDDIADAADEAGDAISSAFGD